MKKILLILLTTIFTLALYACSSNNESASNDSGSNNTNGSNTEEKGNTGPIKIAGIFSASGGAAPLGEPGLETLKMLVEQTNANGGIDVRQVELITYDGKSDQNEAVLSMKRAITQDGAVAVIGGTTSGNSLAMLSLAMENEVPYISTASSQQIYQKEDGSSRKWVFKVTQNDSHAVEKILQYLKEKGLTKVAWLNVANSFGTGGHERFENMAGEYGIEAVIEDEFEATVNDAKPMLTRVRKADPQAIIVWGTVQETSVVIKNIKQLGMDVPIIGSHGIGSAQIFDLAGEAANGVVFPAGRLIVAEQLSDSNPQKEVLLKYKKMYEEKYNKPVSLFGAHSWDAFYMIVEAIKEKGTDKVAIRDYLENGINDFVGLNGIFNMSPDNHNGLTVDSLVMVKIQDNNWVLESE